MCMWGWGWKRVEEERVKYIDVTVIIDMSVSLAWAKGLKCVITT